MIKVVRYTGNRQDATLKRILSRALDVDADLVSRVQSIIDAVRTGGDAALCDYTERFDGIKVTPEGIRVDLERVADLAERVEPEQRDALRAAIVNIRNFHERQIEQSWEFDDGDGVILGQRVTPLDRVGLYIPGGRAVYPSSLVMNAVPAQVAGVKQLVAITPPGSFLTSPILSFAILELGIEEIYTVGGAQAIAALAYGTATIEKVDKIVGPGNVYVALAKKLVFGVVDIDSIAGPSEIVILADSSADPRFVAADMLSQAEHDEDAAAICITTDEDLASGIVHELGRQTAVLERREIAEAALARFGAIFVVDDLTQGCDLVNRLAPEHLELMVEEPDEVARMVRHAGAIFFGHYSTEPVGDYFAGPNHVLPTGGTARFSSPLGVYDFLKRTSIIKYTRERLKQTAPMIAALATAEGLDAHKRAVLIRLQEEVTKPAKNTTPLAKIEDEAPAAEPTTITTAEVTVPETEVDRPTGEVAEPEAVAGKSTAEVTMPEAEVGRPTGEMTTPEAEVGRPTGEMTTPEAVVGKSTAEVTEPDAVAGKSTAEVTEPDAVAGKSTAQIQIEVAEAEPDEVEADDPNRTLGNIRIPTTE